MKLYYAPGACSLADHIALIESGLPHDIEQVDLKAKRTAGGADYREINPKGYVPALRLEDGQTLTENIAILAYIADQSGKLMPRGGMGKWRVLETTAFVSTELHKNFKPFFKPDSSDAEKQAAGDLLDQRFALMEEQLDGRGFIVGETMTIADCYLFVMLMWAKEKAGLDLPRHLSSYYARLRSTPEIERAFAEEGLDS